MKQTCARRKTRDTTPSRSRAQRARSALGVVFLSGLACLLAGCGSKEDLLLGTNEFVLVRRDNFDELDLSYWDLATHTFEDNLAWFTRDSARVADGMLELSVTAEQTPAVPADGEVPKPYAAAELRTKVPFLYGRFRARARMAPGVGIVNAFWGFYDRYAMGGAIDNQIVTECVSTPGRVIRYNVVAPVDAPDAVSRGLVPDPTNGFHVIGYDWTPTEVRFYFDGVLGHSVAGDVPAALTEYQRLVLSAYPSRAGWVGEFDEGSLPVAATYDWVEIYEYAGPRP